MTGTTMFKFKKVAEPTFTSEPEYDLLWGGYILPSELLEDPEQVEEVETAIAVITTFLNEAQEAGVMELG